MRELLSYVRRRGIESGVVEISYCSSENNHFISFDFYDEDTGVYCALESISLVEFSSTKESNVVGDFDLKRIKDSEQAGIVEDLLLKKAKEMNDQIDNRARELAKEISEKSTVNVKVNPKIKGEFQVLTEFEMNMSIARDALMGIDDDY